MVPASLDVIEQAKDILRGQSAEPAKIWEIAKRLKAQKHFGYARRLLSLARGDSRVDCDPQFRTLLRQQHALCTYKDPDLSPDIRFDRALEILGQCDDLASTRDHETLGIAGAINKNKWETFAQKQDLERALYYYLRGYEVGPGLDLGYNGINAAFVLDLLAYEEGNEAEQANSKSETAEARRQQAYDIRKKLLAVLPQLSKQPGKESLIQDWWYLVTLAEVCFGLGHYDDAREWLRKATQIPEVPEWEFESTARQLAYLVRLNGASCRTSTTPVAEATPEVAGREQAEAVLREFLGSKAAGVTTAFRGKVGLALSGGGFRASLYHIGVMARLAELDFLRHVEFLSCVSGGSILGAHYYLEVRRLLQSKADDEITREDYIEIVRRLERDFLAGVQSNIRTRVLADWVSNVRMIFQPNYSRTERAGALYESHLYSRVKDGEEGKDRWLNQLFVAPKDEADGFVPKYHNWRRKAKVPILILNATSLNTGHNWQFTASWMGEPPAGINSQIDGNYRLRRMYYEEAPERYRCYRLGYAVAASACVPGLFEPINLPELYPDRTVRLVDGGVNDNQGVSALLEQGCTALLVSDASGQMEVQNEPGNGPISSLLRSFSISQTRVREAEYHELDARRRSSLIRGFMFVHLKKDLDVDPVDWMSCEDPVDASDESRPAFRRGELTCYGIRRDVQHALAAVRTDLDSFNDVEAFALMTSGYRMTEYEFGRAIREVTDEGPRERWRFLEVERPMKQVGGVDEAHRELMTLLAAANSLAFKIWKLSRPLRYLKNTVLGIAGAAAIVALVTAFIHWRDVRLVRVATLGLMLLSLALTIASAIFGPTLVRIADYRGTLKRIAMGLGMASLGFLIARIHLCIFDPLYLRRGSLENLLRKVPGSNRQPPHAGGAV